MCIVELLNTLELNNNFILDDQIGPESFIKPESSVFDGDGNLSLNLKTSLPQLMRQNGLVDCFQQPRPRLPVNLNRKIDNTISNIVFYH